jgi:hypothetical protein
MPSYQESIALRARIAELNHQLREGTDSEGGGIRTHDLRIKSPLLYQLSYASN